MKKWFVLLLACFTLLSCNKKETPKAIEFELPYSTSIDMEGSGLTINTPVEFTSPDIVTNISSTLNSYSTNGDNIESVRYTQFNVTAVASQGQNLDFIKSLKLYMKAGGQADILVASNENFPTGITTLDLSLMDVNLKNYLLQEKFQVKVIVTPRNPVAQGVTVRINLNQKFKITGKTLIK